MKVAKAGALALIGFLLTLALGVPSVAAQDLDARLAGAEENVASYEEELPGQEDRVAAAEARYRAASQGAAPALAVLRRDRAEVRRLQRQLAAQEKKAAARISQLEEQHQEEVDDHDQTVRDGVGFGIAALVAGLIALGWGWFRASAPIAALAELDLGRALGLCLGGGLLLLVVGAVLGASTGAVGALGSFVFCMGLVLPTALLLARHSVEVQKGRSRPLLRRERLPGWVSAAAAGLMLVLFLASAGSALFADGASSDPISPRLEAEAEAASQGGGAEALSAAREAAAEAQRQAAQPLARRNAARRVLASARRDLHQVQRSLASARSSQRSLARRLVALEAREQREAEREAELVAIEEEEQAEIEEEESASECNPNYSGCLDPYSPDYDCAGGSGDGPDYTGTVEVIGYDEYGLDDDGDGIGCE